MTRDTVPETCHTPTGFKKRAALPLMSYKHVAPAELNVQAFATFLKVFDLLSIQYSVFNTEVVEKNEKISGVLFLPVYLLAANQSPCPGFSGERYSGTVPSGKYSGSMYAS